MRLFRLAQKWDEPLPDNSYWVGVDPLSYPQGNIGGLMTVGQECKHYWEIESLVEDLKADLDQLLLEAKSKMPS